jgi:hypothetical protein
MEQLSWQELSRILLEYEEKSNYDALESFAAKYYPTATRVEVEMINEYDDSTYFQTYSTSSVRFYNEEGRLELPHDSETLAILFALSEALKTNFEATPKTDNPLTWLEEQYWGDFCDLNLYGPERGEDLTVDLTSAPPEPTAVYKILKEG